jgi:hypothetical protein
MEELMKNPNTDSPKQNGDEVRVAYVRDLDKRHGIRLYRRNRHSRQIYTNSSNKTIGIPYASELRRPNWWWLGIKERTDFIVLLCKPHSGDLLDFVFPPDFIAQIWDSLSQDGVGNQFKFHVHKCGGSKYELRETKRTEEIQKFLGGSKILA